MDNTNFTNHTVLSGAEQRALDVSVGVAAGVSVLMAIAVMWGVRAPAVYPVLPVVLVVVALNMVMVHFNARKTPTQRPQEPADYVRHILEVQKRMHGLGLAVIAMFAGLAVWIYFRAAYITLPTQLLTVSLALALMRMLQTMAVVATNYTKAWVLSADPTRVPQIQAISRALLLGRDDVSTTDALTSVWLVPLLLMLGANLLNAIVTPDQNELLNMPIAWLLNQGIGRIVQGTPPIVREALRSDVLRDIARNARRAAKI